MKYKIHSRRRGSITALIGPVLLAAITAGAAATEMTWSSYTSGGQAVLIHGVPETDNQAFQAVCSIGAPDAAIAALLAYRLEGAQADAAILHVASGDFADELPLQRPPTRPTEEGITGVTVAIPTDAPFWQALASGSSLLYAVPGGDVASLNLRGSAAAVRTFIQSCRGTTQ